MYVCMYMSMAQHLVVRPLPPELVIVPVCACGSIFICIHIITHIYVRIYIYIYMHINMYMHVNTYMHVPMFRYTYRCIIIFVNMSVY